MAFSSQQIQFDTPHMPLEAAVCFRNGPWVKLMFGIGCMQKYPIILNHFAENNQLFRFYVMKIIFFSDYYF